MPTTITECLKTALDVEVRRLLDIEMPAGAIIGITNGHGLVWEYAFGRADLASSATPNSDTIFKIASITKTFTATGIFQLRDAGQLSLDDPLERFLPEIANAPALRGRSAEITIRRLLSHTSGLSPHTPVGRPYLSDNAPPGREEALAALKHSEFVVEPGLEYRYSNYGFALLGEVISIVSGHPYAEYVVDRLCTPLGLTSTRFDVSPRSEPDLAPRVAAGYLRAHRTAGLKRTEFADLGFEASAGQLSSTLGDLARWVDFHLAEDSSDGDDMILSVRSRKEMRQPVFVRLDWSGGTCMNWIARKIGDEVMFGHGGSIPGFVLDVSMLPSSGIGVVTLVNSWPVHSSISEAVLTKIADLRTSERPGHVAVLATDPPPEYVGIPGEYALDPDVLIRLEWRTNGLWIWAVDQETQPGSTRLVPTDEKDEFVFPGGPFKGDKLKFERSADHEVTGYVTGAFRVRKLSETSRPPYVN